MLRTSVFLVCLVCSTLATDGNYFKVLIREIDNPAGTLLSGDACSEFNYLGIGCNTYIQAAVSASGHDVSSANTVDSTVPINTHGETRISNLNLVVSDDNVNTVDSFSGFNLHILLASDAQFKNVIDNYTITINTTQSNGVQTYTSTRPSTLSTTISIAWATNISPPSTSSTAEPTTTGLPYTGPSTTAGPTEAPTTTPKLPLDCDEVADKISGVQTIYPDGKTPVPVYCEQASSGAYTVIQSRGTKGTNSSFDIPIGNYSDWFGEPGIGNNFWLGLDNMNSLSENGKSYSLQIDLCCGTKLVAKQFYHKFKVDSKATNYILTASADVPGIGLDYASKVKDIGAVFSTKETYKLPTGKSECDEFEYDDDQSNQPIAYGGWWYGSCGNNLNGFLYPSNDLDCSVKNFADTKMLGVNMRTTSGAGVNGYDVDLVSYDRVRMSLFTFDSALANRNDDSFCK